MWAVLVLEIELTSGSNLRRLWRSLKVDSKLHYIVCVMMICTHTVREGQLIQTIQLINKFVTVIIIVFTTTLLVVATFYCFANRNDNII